MTNAARARLVALAAAVLTVGGIYGATQLPDPVHQTICTAHSAAEAATSCR